MLPECRLDRVHDINLTRAVGCELVLAGEMRTIPSGSVIVVEVDEIWTPRARHHLPFFVVPFPSRAASPARPAPRSTERHPTAPSFQPTVHPWTTESLLAGGRGISVRSFAYYHANFQIRRRLRRGASPRCSHSERRQHATGTQRNTISSTDRFTHHCSGILEPKWC